MKKLQDSIQTLINQTTLLDSIVAVLELKCDTTPDVALARDIQSLATLLDNHREKLEAVTGSLEILSAQSFRPPHEHS